MTKFTVNTYSPSEVQLIIGGYQLTGWESISVVRSVDSYQTIRGIRGKHTRVPSNDSSATITVPLLQTSPSNDMLSVIHNLDLDEGTARLALTLKDKSGGTIISSNEGYILGFPEIVFSGEFQYRAWRIFCQRTESFQVRGNAKPSSIFDGALNEATNFVNSIF